MTTALRAEWRKIRLLPLPRWLALAVLLAAAGAGAVALAAPSGSAASVGDNAQIGLVVGGTVGTVLFAVWRFAVEASEGTLARTFLAEPRRARVAAAKLPFASLLPTALILLAAAITLPLAVAAVNAHGGQAGVADVAAQLAGSAAQAALVGPTCFVWRC
jgi:hypothetical protein